MLRRRALTPASLLLALGLAAGCSTDRSTAARTPAPTSPAAPTTTTAATPPPPATPSTSLPTAPTTAHTMRRPHRTPTPAARVHAVVVLDPGHDGGNGSHPELINRLVPAGYGQHKACNTTGTATDAGYAEHAFTWDVATRVRSILAARGITVVSTRPNDTGVGPCVDERAAIGNRAHATAVVSIHGDGSYSGHGFHVIRTSYDPGGPAVAADSLRLATDVHAGMIADSGLTAATYIGSGGYDSRSDLGGLNLSTRPTVMVECGNMRNAGDAAIQSSPAGRQRIATALATGILRYLAGRHSR